MRNIVASLIIVCFCGILSAAKPMEVLGHYNVVLVHGAAPENQGFEKNCGNDVKDAWNTLNDNSLHPKDSSWNLGDAVGMLGKYEDDGEKKLTYWLDSAVFEDTVRYGSEYIYIQRSFANPAASPSHNAHEIGDRTWKGTDNCSVRRSLFEEAQEVRASGAGKLDSLRRDGLKSFRSVPSRNILIAHSMGGVASHEYVTDLNVYNGDVDKLVTLDSPHEGTGALNLLIDMRDYGRQAAEAAVQYLLLTTLGTSICAVAKDPYSVGLALWLLVPTFGLSAAERGVTALVDEFALGEDYAFKRGDSLTRYIFPGADGVTALMTRPAHENMPMVRLLAGKGGMTFSDPNEGSGEVLNFLIPEGISTAVKNAVAQLGGDGSASAVYANVETGLVLGLLGGISVRDVGTTLIPEGSGLATSTEAFNGSLADVRRFAFDAAAHANSAGVARQAARNVAEMAGIVSGVIAADIGLSAFPVIQVAAKVAIALSGAAVLGLDMYETGIADIMESHENAKTRRMLDTLYSADFSYTKVKGGNESGRVRLMEDFLYERPFVNLGLFVSADSLQAVDAGCFYEKAEADKELLCEIGLYRSDSSGLVPFKMQNYAQYQKSPLRFRSSSDWSRMGVKVDRWERVDGLSPEGNLAPKSVPIRHVERYAVPSIAVDDWIEKYSFVVDDLMPHRLRQIRMNFNYQEEIAWECDVKKDPDANDACIVYKRSGGGEWAVDSSVGDNGRVRHPVQKNGIFDFEPRKYGYSNLLLLQKDNQNTVTVSTVNKIGLSNTQRFYYLFKATDNLLEPLWPLPGVAVNRVSGFRAHVSVLDYQGFSVVSARDAIFQDTSSPSPSSFLPMTRVPSGNRDAIFNSEREMSGLSGGYVWQFRTVTMDSVGGTLDSSDFYNVPFTVDTVPPSFRLSAEAFALNPDSVSFLARFAWDGAGVENPDIRAMRWQLSRVDGGLADSLELSSLYDVASQDFAVPFDSASRKFLAEDGLYRVSAYAVDNAAPNASAYEAVNALVSKIADGTVSAEDWERVQGLGLNAGSASAEFRVDRTPPVLKFDTVGAVVPEGASAVGEYASLERPHRREGFAYVSDDSLLSVAYTVSEALAGRDSASVRVNFAFLHIPDTAAVDRVGDSLWLSGDSAHFRWTEMSGLRLSDGDYLVRATARDEASNQATFAAPKKLRIDRTAPRIESLVSRRLVYPDSVREFSAEIAVSESGDVDSNRTGMRCHYRVMGKTASGWMPIADSLLHSGKITFPIDSGAVGRENGKRYLETVCLDAAGNAGVRTDLFYVGSRYPEITFPKGSMVSGEMLAISGIAPPDGSKNEESVVYRLRYRAADAGEWRSAGMSVVAGNRSADSSHISRLSQSSSGVLGYLDRCALAETCLEGAYVIELGVRACDSCPWRTDSAEVYFLLGDSTASGNIVLNALRDSMTVGSDSLSVNVRLDGNIKGKSLVRLYAEDSRGVGIFDISSENIYASPFTGTPSDTTLQQGVWFYWQDSLWHLRWKGFAGTDEIRVRFDSETFGTTCEGPGGTTLERGCSVEFSSMDLGASAILSETLSGYPYFRPMDKADSAMSLSGNSGHVVFKSSGMFRIEGSQDSSFANRIPVFFGSATAPGFSQKFGSGAEYLNPLFLGWTVNPENERLHYVWDGKMSSGAYPAPGKITLYAEAVQTGSEDAFVILDTAFVNLKLPPLEIALADSLGDFVTLQGGIDTSTAALGKMNIEYGVLYRDAFVKIYVEAPDGTKKLLQDSVLCKANSSATAYSAAWDGTINGVAPVSGTYKVIIEANEVGTSVVKSATSHFNVRYASSLVNMETRPGDSSAPQLYIAEAFRDDDGKNRYIPEADYLVRAELGGKYLPKYIRDSLSFSATVFGSQKAIGYKPERFSLALKRHRERLDLVILYQIDRHIESVTNTVCEIDDEKNQPHRSAELLTFTSNSRSGFIDFEMSAGENYGYSDHENASVKMCAVMNRDWLDYRKDHEWNEKAFKTLCDDYAIWKLTDISDSSVNFISKPKAGGYALFQEKSAGGCSAEDLGGESSTQCEYGQDEAGKVVHSENYNPNLNLFRVELIGNSDFNFYTDKGEIKSDHCGNERFRMMKFRMKFTIPDSYWDADFGYDNLVNRTVRFDEANKTIFGKTDGYLKILSEKNLPGDSNYFDGTRWQKDHSYGKLTPFEMQRLRFYPANVLPGGGNTFLFADEDSSYIQPSYFDMKFYSAPSETDYFQVLALGTPVAGIDGCDYSPETNFDAAYGNPQPRCQVSHTSKTDAPEQIRTPLFAGGYVDFYVARNTVWSGVPDKVNVPYPAPISFAASTGDSLKFYAAGSKVHYYYGDYGDSTWLRAFTDTTGIIRNAINSPADYSDPANLETLGVIPGKIGGNLAIANLSLSNILSPENYRNGSFDIPLDTLGTLKSLLNAEGIRTDSFSVAVNAAKGSVERFGDTLHVKAFDWNDAVLYRKTLDSLSKLPTLTDSTRLSLYSLYRYQSGIRQRDVADKNLYYGPANKAWTRNPWIKDVRVESSELQHLDSSVHSHFAIAGNRDSLDRTIFYHSNDSIARPAEFIELSSYLSGGKTYHLFYLKEGVFHSILDTAVEKSGFYRLKWFNANRLQGNTTFMLTWGGDGGSFYYSRYDLYVGTPVGPESQTTVSSLFGDLSVTFPKGSLRGDSSVTVRTADASDYPFDVFRNVPLTGPVMEVLPTMTFAGPDYPRVQMKISREEMERNRVTPQTLRLYKIDFDNKQFVPLENALYGYLKADGSPAASGADTTASCAVWDDPQCYGNDYSYILISAETRTFSVFAAMDSSVANIPEVGLEILPAVATARDRLVRVSGTTAFHLYADDDSLLDESNDGTPATSLFYKADSSGLWRVTLPERDTNYLFAVALDASGAERSTASAKALALTLPAEFSCTVPADSLWLGLDNGYLAFETNCNQPGRGILSLYGGGLPVAEIHSEIPDTLIYDGKVSARKIPPGIYDSRFLGFSLLGSELQIAGPKIRTDSLRPEIDSMAVEESSQRLDRNFHLKARLSDTESGIAKVLLTAVFGGDTLSHRELETDSSGALEAEVHLTRETLASCVGCRLSLSLRAEDFGHNYSVRIFRSEKLYPYPASLALWYPAGEGSGKISGEMLGTGHDLQLNLFKPWLADFGLYFYHPGDNAAGIGKVDLGTSDAYSFEARIKRGYAQDSSWRRVLGFVGTSGLNISLEMRGGDLRLVENGVTYSVSGALPLPKSWSHIVVTVDSAQVRFYVDGELKKALVAKPLERELYGTFSIGKREKETFVGNIADIRMYAEALSAEEIEELATPVDKDGKEIHTVVLSARDMEVSEGLSPQFSCAVAGNRYYSAEENAFVSVPVSIPAAGSYGIILYARSVTANSATVKVGLSQSALRSGALQLAPVWEASAVGNLRLALSAGQHRLFLSLPAGLEIAGIALTDGEMLPPSNIAWGAGLGEPERKIESYVRFDGYPDASVIRPRLKLVNTSDETVRGFAIRYYFRGEDPAQVVADAYYPQSVIPPSVHGESAQTGFVEWNFGDTEILPGASPFYGEGPHFGIHNGDYSAWVPSDDPSFVENAATSFVKDWGIVVLDAEKNLVGGSCIEMEDSASVETKVRILAADARNDAQASEIHLKLENVGSIALKNYDVRYSFYSEGIAPIFDVYYLPPGISARMDSLGAGRYQVTLHGEASVGPGTFWSDVAKFALHFPGWQSAWDASDDPSHAGLTAQLLETSNVAVFDSLGNRIYGNEPEWPSPLSVVAETFPTADTTKASDNGEADTLARISRTEDGLLLELGISADVSLDLVNILGTPVQSLFNGKLSSGEHLISVDWSGVDMKTTYLALKINGSLKSASLLSLL